MPLSNGDKAEQLLLRVNIVILNFPIEFFKMDRLDFVRIVLIIAYNHTGGNFDLIFSCYYTIK